MLIYRYGTPTGYDLDRILNVLAIDMGPLRGGLYRIYVSYLVSPNYRFFYGFAELIDSVDFVS